MAKVMEEDVGLKGLRDTQCARLIAEQVCRQGAPSATAPLHATQSL